MKTEFDEFAVGAPSFTYDVSKNVSLLSIQN